MPANIHPKMRNRKACLLSSTFAVELAKEYQSRLHVLHLTTKEEMKLFSNTIPLNKKNITSEVCGHHLWFDSSDYKALHSKIKCNPSIKAKADKKKLLYSLRNGTIDVVASDHAPHTFTEKNSPYYKAPAGLPLVQHTFSILLELYHQKSITLQEIVQKTSHNVAEIFCIPNRGYIREGYFADIAIFDLRAKNLISKENIFYKCGWSPFEGKEFHGKVTHTFVNGFLVYKNGSFFEHNNAQRLVFSKDRRK